MQYKPHLIHACGWVKCFASNVNMTVLFNLPMHGTATVRTKIVHSPGELINFKSTYYKHG